MLLENGEPSNYEEAMAGPDSDKWLEAMKSEIESMYEKQSMDFDWLSRWSASDRKQMDL